MKTYYVIRSGWNSANQTSVGSKRNPSNKFESNLYSLVLITEADSAEEAVKKFTGTVYNNQSVFATSNPRSIKGLTAAIREHSQPA